MPVTARAPLRRRRPRACLRRAGLLVALVLFACPALGAKSPEVPLPAATDTLNFTIDQAVQRALAQGIEMRLAQAQIAVANGQVREALAPALPQVSGGLTYLRRFASSLATFEGDTVLGPIFKSTSFGAVNSWVTEFTASQLVWSGGRVSAGLGAAHAVRRSATAGRAQTAADVTRQVKVAYLQAAAAGKALAIARAGLDQARAHMRQVEQYRSQGTRAEYDLIRAQVDAANQEPPVVAAKNAWELAALELKRLMNLPLGQPISLETPLALESDMVPVVRDSVLDGGDRAALEQAHANVTMRSELLRLERAQRWPQLLLNGRFSQEAYPTTDRLPTFGQFRGNAEASVRLDFPLFLGLRTFGAVQRATAELRQAEYQREQLQQGISLEVANAVQEARRTLAVLAARRGTVQLSQRAYHLASVRYSSGLATQLEVSDAQLQMQTAELNEVQATRDYLAALVELEHAVGRPLRIERRPLEEASRGLDEGE